MASQKLGVNIVTWLVLYAITFLISSKAVAQPINTVDDICRQFEGRILGQSNGTPYRATCTEIKHLSANAGTFIPRPFFWEFRELLRRERANDFRIVIANDPTLRRMCAESRSRSEVVCEMPLGALNTVIFSLNRQYFLEKATISVDRKILDPVLQNQSSRNNLSNPTVDFALMLLNIAIIHVRTMSEADELYSIRGNNIVYEFWPWRLR